MLYYVTFPSIKYIEDIMAEWSKAVPSGGILNWRGFKSHWCHLITGQTILQNSIICFLKQPQQTHTYCPFKNYTFIINKRIPLTTHREGAMTDIISLNRYTACTDTKKQRTHNLLCILDGHNYKYISRCTFWQHIYQLFPKLEGCCPEIIGYLSSIITIH